MLISYLVINQLNISSGDMNYRTTFDPKVPQGETKHVPVQLDGAAAAAADEEAKKENFEDEEDTEVAEETPQR